MLAFIAMLLAIFQIFSTEAKEEFNFTLRKRGKKFKLISISNSSDPYPSIEEKILLTRNLEILSRRHT
jgi:DNA repair photolyase